MKLANCTVRTWLGHAACHGWQCRFGTQPPAEILICSCRCGHKPARNMAQAGVLRPPPGYTVEQFLDALPVPQEGTQE